jgi:hypothetical protein
VLFLCGVQLVLRSGVLTVLDLDEVDVAPSFVDEVDVAPSFVEVFRSTDWCVKKGKIPDTQFGFFPGRSTLHPLFILRHLRHAAKMLKPRNSPRLHVAFIDFSQAYDTPRQQLWSHLRRSAMPSTLLSVIKHMYENDEYILMDGEKRARVHPTNGVNRGALCPPSFSLCTSMTWAERSVRVP